MRARWPLAAAAGLLALALVSGGAAPFGRLLLASGLPGLAVPFLSDPGWRGVALYRAGDAAGAAEAFRAARAFHNLGNAEVKRGRYAAALEAYDIARAGGDADAGANFDLVAAYYAGLALDPETPIAWFTEKDRDGEIAAAPLGQGSARAAGTGDETTNAGTLLGLPELLSRGKLGVRRVFDDKFMVANDRWLAQLSDVPGEYLRARIAAERKRRRDAGLAPPDAEDTR